MARQTLPSKGELIFAHDAVLEIVDLSETTYQQLDGCPAQRTSIDPH